ncbi:MAG: hypothetical protein [Inoviridae sp.]|nr:MAG: hypothetical protein [Inoviridae sp.]
MKMIRDPITGDNISDNCTPLDKVKFIAMQLSAMAEGSGISELNDMSEALHSLVMELELDERNED